MMLLRILEALCAQCGFQIEMDSLRYLDELGSKWIVRVRDTKEHQTLLILCNGEEQLVLKI